MYSCKFDPVFTKKISRFLSGIKNVILNSWEDVFKTLRKRSSFWPKIDVFAPKMRVFLAPWDIFTWMHLKYWVSVRMLIAIPVKMERKLHFKASKSSKMSILGLNGRFFAPEMTFFVPKMLILFTQNINTLMVTKNCDCRHSF